MKRRANQALMALLGFGAFTACNMKSMYGCPPTPLPPAEYGCPYAEYNFNVDVVDGEQDTPIEGVRVSVINKYNEQFTDTLVVAQTDAKGKAMLSIEGETYSNHTLAIDDIDGEDNGGEYNSTTVTVSTDSDNYVGGDGNWNIGTATHNVKVALSKKGEQE